MILWFYFIKIYYERKNVIWRIQIEYAVYFTELLFLKYVFYESDVYIPTVVMKAS